MDSATLRGAAQYGLSQRRVVSSVIAPRSYLIKVNAICYISFFLHLSIFGYIPVVFSSRFLFVSSLSLDAASVTSGNQNFIWTDLPPHERPMDALDASLFMVSFVKAGAEYTGQLLLFVLPGLLSMSSPIFCHQHYWSLAFISQ
jgi:hypothetical protein